MKEEAEAASKELKGAGAWGAEGGALATHENTHEKEEEEEEEVEH